MNKTDKIRAAWAAGDKIAALRIGGRFFDRSIDTKAFKQAVDAYNNPEFYRHHCANADIPGSEPGGSAASRRTRNNYGIGGKALQTRFTCSARMCR
jgi:hypothetical protein